jgi:Asp-tRNA(Asn)/Glu-tRNA(Gln) amidotransferase A subunit family amidase
MTPSPPSVSSSPLRRPLRIGYIITNNFFTPAPCCQRALKEAIDTLRADGHELIHWSPPSLSFSKPAFLTNQIFVADSCQWLRSILSHEFPHTTILGGVLLGLIPSFLLFLLSHVLLSFSYTTRLGHLLKYTFANSYFSVSKVWKMNSEISKYRSEFLEFWKLSKFDLLLCPTMALPAVDHHQTTHLLPVVMYTSIFNLLEYPVGHCPITRVRKEECYYTQQGGGGEGGGTREEEDLFSVLANEQMKTSEGLPIGVSVIGLPYDDESVLNVMKILEQKFPFVPSL